ncbi:MAG: glutathione-regulated potassium-efflux system protein KefC [Polyangiaceae bacterium]|nr:glutathione-regulated potassium-efflux system protein KefC [Polyangiaceae bacterium]
MSQHSILTDAIVYLAAAVVCVPLASRSKLGSVLGYLAAGCIIGPFGLRLVADPHATLEFAEIGVVLMLFVIGLELDPSHLWKMRRSVFGGGSLQLFACATPLGLGLLALGLPWQGALVAGLALGLSSTAVAMQTMAEKSLLTSPVGKTSFAILLFQDIAAIPLLAMVPLLAEAAPGAASQGSGWLGAGKVLFAVAAVFVIGRFLTRPVLRILASTGLREVFTGFALLLVLGIAQIMASVGISMALGAFLAGVLLAGSEYRHALEGDIEPFKGLLMGLFFIAVGMSIDFGLLTHRPLFVLGLVLGFQVLKVLALRLVAGPLGITTKQRWLIGALLAQGGEFAFVVFGVARSARLLPGDWDALLTLAVALSMALTPLLMILHDKLILRRQHDPERDADEIVDEGTPVIIAGFGRFGQIVGRLLFASGIKATVLDHDPDTIELLKRFNFRIYYGDATRLDLLHAAGALQAQVLVVAIDDVESSVKLVETVRENFPRLRIVARARNVGHWQRLRSLGVEVVERETFEAAITVGRHALQFLGVRPYEAKERADVFRRHNVRAMEAILPHWQDVEARTRMAISARDQLERQMENDRLTADMHGVRGWHSEPLPTAEALAEAQAEAEEAAEGLAEEATEEITNDSARREGKATPS